MKIGQVNKHSVTIEEALRDNAMNMRIPLKEVAGGMDGENCARDTTLCNAPGHGLLHSLLHGFKGTFRNQLQKPSVAQHDPSNQ